jgi:glycerophosphoryl diester phosphodiesterase
MRFSAIAAMLLPLALSVFAADREVRREFLENGVTAHRGSSIEYPENTIAAIRHAIELQVDWVEVDILQTKDGQLVILHDSTTGRTGDRDLKVADSTYEELLAVDVAAGHRRKRGLSLEACPVARIPLLSEVLPLFTTQGRTRLSLQPKDDCTAAAIALVRKMGAVEWVGFNDGNLTKMSLVKELEPGIPVFWDRPAACDLAADLRIAREKGFEALVIEQRGITEKSVRQCREAGFQVGAWTVNDPETMQRFLAWGVDRLYTDDPRALLNLESKFKN